MRSRLGSTASESAIAAAAAADAQAADDATSLSLEAALQPHAEALAKADVRRVTFLSPRPGHTLENDDDGSGRCGKVGTVVTVRFACLVKSSPSLRPSP